MVSKRIIAATAVATVGANAQVGGIVTSIVGQISAGLVAGRASGADSAQVASEVGQIISALNANTDVDNLFTEAAQFVLGGIDSAGVISIIGAASASLAAFEGSPDFSSVLSLVGAHISDLNPDAAIASVSANLSPVLGLVLPPISSLSAGDATIAAAVNGAVATVEGLYSTLLAAGGSKSSSAAASSVASSSAAASFVASSAAASSTVKSSAAASSAKATAAATSVAHVSSTNSTSTSLAQVNGVAPLKTGAVVAGVFAAGALLL